MQIQQLRDAFLRYFEARAHHRIPSSPLVPHGDPSLLFTSAGMVQFKPYFLGLEEPPARRMTSIQKCFRTTDIEEVGDASHLTFFEMLGNFSVGDYFKPEAVSWAWEFLTQELGLPVDRLWATVYEDDDEAYELWRAQGVPEWRILRLGVAHGNYWFSGDTGPCGPCSELHYDFGTDAEREADRAGGVAPDLDSDRFLEVWNLVFMAFDRQPDGSRVPLPAQNIDTGAGLERLAWVLQSTDSVYETDELRRIVAAAEAATGHAYDPTAAPEAARALRVLTEHARAFAFLVADGVLPGNEGRGYVLRRMLRRAIYFGHQLGVSGPCFAPVVAEAVAVSGAAAPDLARQRDFILQIAEAEEARFRSVLDRGLQMLDDVFAREAARHPEGARVVPGADMFVLYDTHGLPPELTREVAARRGFAVDDAGFEQAMTAQRERSRGAEGFTDFDDPRAERFRALDLRSAFVGYEALNATAAVAAIVTEDATPARLAAGEEGEVVLTETACYPEGGGQVGDHGEIITPGGHFAVFDTQRVGEAIAHRGRVLAGTITVGEPAESRVDSDWRQGSQRNHTATHLLHAALRQVLGDHVRQAGSYVGPDRLRFDYTHPGAPTAEELARVQRLVTAKVREDIARETVELPYEEAMARGAIAFFDDRYQANVRMVEYCEVRGHGHHHAPECFSRELCGGTHLHTTGGVGHFQIVSDSSIGAGIRRIEALTGPEAETYVEERLALLDALGRRFKVPVAEVPARVDALEEQLQQERRRAEAQARQAAAGQAEELAAAAIEQQGLRVGIARVEAASAEALRELGDRLRRTLGDTAVVLLGAVVDDKPLFVGMVGPGAVDRGVRADALARAAAQVAGGGGGGRPEMAQAGGRDATQLDRALEAARQALADALG